ncbi:MAG: tyrosine-type recombinase/integrase [Oscillospiraceae bacterium]
MSTCKAIDDISFGGVLDNWLISQRQRLKRTTLAAYETILERHIKPGFKGFSPGAVTDDEVLQFLAEKCGESSLLAPATLCGITSVLRSALTYGGRFGCAARPETCRCSVKPYRSEITVLSDAERLKIVSEIGEIPDGKDLGILLCLNTGLRVGEICGLKWGDIDLGAGTLSVRRTLSRIRNDVPGGSKTVLYFGTPKSRDSRRIIPLSPGMLVVLRRQKRENEAFLLSNRADKPIEPRNLQRYFKCVLARAGVRDMNFHALRHTFATKCVELGFDIKSLSMILGHSDVSITLNTYVHPSFERLKSMMALLDN